MKGNSKDPFTDINENYNYDDDEKENQKEIEVLKFQQIPEIDTKNKLTISNFRDNNHNLEKLNFCTQNIEWDLVNKNREEFIYQCEVHQNGTRNNPELSVDEQNQKSKFKRDIKTDIFFTFSAFHFNIEPIYNHFQLRKNLMFISEKELVYFNPKGIEMLNIITNLSTQLIIFPQNLNNNNSVDDMIICYDAFKINNSDSNLNKENFSDKKFQVFFAFGKFNNRITLQKIQVFYKQKKLQSEIIFTKEIKVSDLEEQNQLINHVEFSKDKKFIYTCCNDSYIKIFDINTFQEICKYKSPNCVNHLGFNFSGNIISVVGDYEEVILIDPKSKDVISKMKGHYDYGFTARFQKNSDFLLATSNQDNSARIWDLRKLEDVDSGINLRKFDPCYFNYENFGVTNEAGNSGPCLKTYFGNNNAIGDVKFVQKDFLVLLENTYNLHIVNMPDDTMQSVKYIGQSIGFDFHENLEKLFLGIYQHDYAGIYAFKKIGCLFDI